MKSIMPSDTRISLAQRIGDQIASLDDGIFPYLGGSLATGYFDEHSDVDILIYSRKMPTTRIRSHIPLLGTNHETANEVDMFHREGVKIDLTYVTDGKLEKIAKGSSDFITYIHIPIPLIDKYPKIEKRKKEFDVSDYIFAPQEIQDKISLLIRDTDKLSIALERGENCYVQYLTNYFMERAVKIILSVNERPYVYPKKSLSEIRDLEVPEMLKGFLQKASSSTTPTEWKVFFQDLREYTHDSRNS